MVIREGDNYIEIEAVDRVPEHLPTAEDVGFSVRICSNGFSGQGFAWVEGPQLATFLAQLRQLEEQRQGAAALEGISPAEFELRIWSVNRRGHMAVGGRLGSRVRRGEVGPYPHAVEFGFEFDPTSLPKILAGFQAIAEGRA